MANLVYVENAGNAVKSHMPIFLFSIVVTTRQTPSPPSVWIQIVSGKASI